MGQVGGIATPIGSKATAWRRVPEIWNTALNTGPQAQGKGRANFGGKLRFDNFGKVKPT